MEMNDRYLGQYIYFEVPVPILYRYSEALVRRLVALVVSTPVLGSLDVPKASFGPKSYLNLRQPYCRYP
jgi:hypothetical protein